MDLIKEHAAQPFENCNNNNSDSKLKSEQQVVKECVISHKKAIEYMQLLQCIYKWTLLCTSGLNLIIISISAVQVLSKMFQWLEMMIAITYIGGELTHLFFLSLMAQFIMDKSLNVYESAYLGSWYDMSTKIQKDIILILMRSCNPCKMTAGKLFVMSLESFCMILQTSMSYFTVLVSFR